MMSSFDVRNDSFAETDREHAYRQLLAIIDSELLEDNIKSLKFLCEPYLGTKKSATNFSSGFEIFHALEKSKKIDQYNLRYLSELLYAIGRVDLATRIDPEFKFSNPNCNLIDQFRLMLFKVSEDLASDEVTRLRFLYENVPKRVIITDGIDLFSLMLQHNILSPNNVNYLCKMIEGIERHDLHEIIRRFCGEESIRGEYYCDIKAPPGRRLCYIDVTEVVATPESSFNSKTSSVYANDEQMSEEPMDESQNHSSQQSQCSNSDNESYQFNCNNLNVESSTFQNKFTDTVRIQDMNDVENKAVSMEPAGTQAEDNDPEETNQMTSTSIEPYTPLEYYKMTAQPRGYCVVIDNQEFKPDCNDPEAVKNLGNREGSSKDSDALMASFQKLKFIVDVKFNLKDNEIIHYLKQMSIQDHEKFDCFVCCILSHGGENHVYGVNGRKVNLGDITSMFRAQSCPTLARKPKLFFMASCRGKDHQQTEQHFPSEPMLETDTPRPDINPSEWVPNEADFLYGYSTVVNYVSYRSKSQGTFYIQALTKALDMYAHREELQDLLLRVNAEVTEKIFTKEERGYHMVYKQTPAPQHTLRKKLKFL